MTQRFKLTRNAEIVPDTGETMGGELAKAAGALPMCWAKAELYCLAADAYEHGASVSIGHNRADRYMQRAKECRHYADNIETTLKAGRDAVESERLLAAFRTGYDGLDITSYAFEARKAAILGQHFAAEKREMPKRLNMVCTPRPLGRDSAPDHLVDDLGQKFIVEYPNGKIDQAVVKQID